jgi:tetratricopeptide (TPR) repeat protein
MFSPDIRNRYQAASQLKADLLAFQSGKALVQPSPPIMQATPASPAPAATRKSRGPRVPVFAVLVLVVIGLIALALAISANTMMDFARAADAAQPESQESIMQAAQAYKNLDRYGGVPRMLAAMTSRAPGKLRNASLAFAERIITKYARELDLPEKGNVSEREWKAAMDVLAVGRDIDDSREVEAMLAYAKGHYHRINAESRIGMSAPADRKKNERALGLDHYTQAETYFNEALDLKPEWSDAQFGLVRLYASVFPEMDKAEGAMMVAERWEANPPLRLQFEMAWGHHARAAELSRTVMDSLKALSKEPPGPVADLNLSSARSDLDQMDNHIRRALSYFDACLSRGACWDARFRRTKVGALMVTSDAQRSLLGEMELRLRIPPSQELP